MEGETLKKQCVFIFEKLVSLWVGHSVNKNFERSENIFRAKRESRPAGARISNGPVRPLKFLYFKRMIQIFKQKNIAQDLELPEVIG